MLLDNLKKTEDDLLAEDQSNSDVNDMNDMNQSLADSQLKAQADMDVAKNDAKVVKKVAQKQTEDKAHKTTSGLQVVLALGGHQYRACLNEALEVDRVDCELDHEFVSKDVLMTISQDGVLVGSPYVDGCEVKLKVLKHYRDPKVIVFKKKRRKKYRRMTGHKQLKSLVMVTAVNFLAN